MTKIEQVQAEAFQWQERAKKAEAECLRLAQAAITNTQYLVEYERGQGATPWAVCRLVPKTLCAWGKVWIANFKSEADALAWIAERVAQ